MINLWMDKFYLYQDLECMGLFLANCPSICTDTGCKRKCRQLLLCESSKRATDLYMLSLFAKAFTATVNDYQTRHQDNKRHRVSNHRQLDCLLSRLFRQTAKETPKLRITGPRTLMAGGFPSQTACDADKVSMLLAQHRSILISSIAHNHLNIQRMWSTLDQPHFWEWLITLWLN